MWGHYGSKIMRIFLRPLSKVLGLTSYILWGYRLSLYEKLCPIYFFRELGSNGSVFMLYVSYLNRPVLEEYVS
jgi:hypothetical protein